MGEGYAVGKKAGIPRKILNARVGTYYAANEFIGPNVYVQLSDGELVRATTQIFGLTKTKCSPEKAGRVWIL